LIGGGTNAAKMACGLGAKVSLLGIGGCGHRSGRLLRDAQSHHPRRPHFYRRGRVALLRSRYAGRRTENIDHGADQRHPAVRGRDRQQGVEKAVAENREIKRGANVVNGNITYKEIAEAFGLEYVPIDGLL
jgi:hypothetical protein